METASSDLAEAFRGHVAEIVKVRCGNRAIQRCLQGPQNQLLLNEVMAQASAMIFDGYGVSSLPEHRVLLYADIMQHFIIKWILKRGPVEEKGMILDLLKGHIFDFSFLKYASRVCTAAIHHSQTLVCEGFVEEILFTDRGGFRRGVWEMIQDPNASMYMLLSE